MTSNFAGVITDKNSDNWKLFVFYIAHLFPPLTLHHGHFPIKMKLIFSCFVNCPLTDCVIFCCLSSATKICSYSLSASFFDYCKLLCICLVSETEKGKARCLSLCVSRKDAHASTSEKRVGKIYGKWPNLSTFPGIWSQASAWQTGECPEHSPFGTDGRCWAFTKESCWRSLVGVGRIHQSWCCSWAALI